MDLVSRLKQYLDSRQISITQFADECSIPRPTGSQLLAGRNKKVSDEIISKIHAAYPDLSIVWLMFGEGDMVKDGNIEISEPQNQGQNANFDLNDTEGQSFGGNAAYSAKLQRNQSEKIPGLDDTDYSYDSGEIHPAIHQHGATKEPAVASTFSFSNESAPAPSITAESSPAIHPDKNNDSITVTPGKGKRVTGIVVYYDDNTYESFIPDPKHGHPFMR